MSYSAKRKVADRVVTEPPCCSCLFGEPVRKGSIRARGRAAYPGNLSTLPLHLPPTVFVARDFPERNMNMARKHICAHIHASACIMLACLQTCIDTCYVATCLGVLRIVIKGASSFQALGFCCETPPHLRTHSCFRKCLQRVYFVQLLMGDWLVKFEHLSHGREMPLRGV